MQGLCFYIVVCSSPSTYGLQPSQPNAQVLNTS